MTRPKLPPVDVYRLLSDGLEGPLRYGLRRAFKHDVLSLTHQQEERLIGAQHDALMLWFSDTFQFPEVK